MGATKIAVFLLLVNQAVLGGRNNLFGCPCGEGRKGPRLNRRVQKRSASYNETSTAVPSNESDLDLVPIGGQERIVNGYEPNERAWMALLEWPTINRKRRCTGSVINKKFVITAAHCICNRGENLPCEEHNVDRKNALEEMRKKCKDKKKTHLKPSWDIKDLTIALGINEIIEKNVLEDKFPKLAKTRLQKPSNIYVHECYEDGKFFFDIALIKLERYIDLSSKVNNRVDDNQYDVHPICVREKYKKKEHVAVTGYGYTAEEKNEHKYWCKTSINSPKPAAACRFPFKAGGSEKNECAKVDVKKVKGYFKNEEGDRMSGRCKAMHKHYRKKKEDEKLWEDVDFVKLVGKEGKRITNCYKPKKVMQKVCATCNENASKGEAGYCHDFASKNGKDEKEIPDILLGSKEEKKHWGFCDMVGNACNNNKQPPNLFADRLMETDDMKVVKNGDCAEMFRKRDEKFDDEHELCATGIFIQTYREVRYTKKRPKYTMLDEKKTKEGKGYTDSCGGDSGGPLFYWSKETRRKETKAKAYLYGLVSRGVGCAQPNTPAIYTKVSSYVKWMQGLIREKYYCRH